MATKKRAGKQNRAVKQEAAPAKPMKICFERIIPDEVDPEQPVRRVLREQMVKSAGKRLNADEVHNLTRMALVNSKKWPNGATLSVRFLDGSAKMRRNTEKHAHRWEEYANIKFKFIKKGPAEIRVSFFADDGSWSAVGRDSLNTAYFPTHQPTMNYGWLRDDTDDDEYSRVVLHEFGHAISCIHEHQQPKFDRKWDKDAVAQAFQGPPNFWSPDDIDANVLSKYSPRGISATMFDPKSIMLYAFDADLFSDGKGPTNSNSKLSAKDISMIKQMYPK
jgi:hypothetical protein